MSAGWDMKEKQWTLGIGPEKPAETDSILAEFITGEGGPARLIFNTTLPSAKILIEIHGCVCKIVHSSVESLVWAITLLQY